MDHVFKPTGDTVKIMGRTIYCASEDEARKLAEAVNDLRDLEIRTLRWKLKSICKQNGKQGQTIHELRCLTAALREAVRFSPGDRARLFGQLRTAEVENRRLREKLAAADEPVPYVPVDDNLYAQTPAQAKAVEDFVNNGTTSPEAARAYSGVATDDGAFGRKA